MTKLNCKQQLLQDQQWLSCGFDVLNFIVIGQYTIDLSELIQKCSQVSEFHI